MRIHVRVGYVLAILLGPAVCIILVVADAIRVRSLGVSFFAALQVTLLPFWWLHGALTFVALAILLPAVIAPWVALSRGAKPLTAILVTRGRWVIVAHLVLALASWVGLLFCYQLRQVGGYSWVEGQRHFAFRSWYLNFLTDGPSMFWTVVSSVFVFLSGISQLLNYPGTRKLDLNHYYARLRLAALKSRLVPVHAKRSVNMRSPAALAPILYDIRTQWLKSMSQYHRCVPGSPEAKDFLARSWGQVKDLLATVGVRETTGMQLRFVGSTSRAMEIAIQELGPGARILLSPYEHPSERIVAGSVGSWTQMKVANTFFNLPWEEQRDGIINWVDQETHKAHGVLVISEVAWETGRLIRVEELVREVKAKCGRNLFGVVIDGAHAVGNVSDERPVSVADAYVFSGHKWLLAPEPSGIILSRSPREFHDAWVHSLPASSVGCASVTALLAALQFRQSLDRWTLSERIKELRDLLVASTRDRFEIIGEKSSLEITNFLTLKPRRGFQWASRGSTIDVEEVLAHDGFYVTGITRDREQWVRVAISFYLDWTAINDFSRSVLRIIERTA